MSDKGGLLAALTRRAGDFAKFVEKTVPVAADNLLLEDSASAGAKKKVQVGNLPFPVLTSSAPAAVTKAAASVGVATTAAKADHKHDVSTASAGGLSVGGSSSEGSATSLARSDHAHALPAFGSSGGTFCQGNDSRLADDRTAAGLRTATTIVSISSATAPVLGQVLTALSGTAADWETPLALTSSAPANVTKAAASAGVATDIARSDHKHDISTASAVGVAIGGSNSEGSATSLARSDHTHSLASFGTTGGTFCQGNDSRLSDDRPASGLRPATTIVSVSSATAPTNGQVLTATSGTAATWQTPLLLTASSPANVTKAAAAVGVATDAARSDHKHDITTASAGGLSVGGSSSEGAATTLARSDHGHALPAFGSSGGTFCQGNDSRLADDRTASGIRTATTIVSVNGATAPTNGQVLTATSGTAATWQTPLALTSSAPVNVDKSAAAVGVSSAAARDDHKHDISTASASGLSVGGANAEGTANTLARSDHLHSLPSFGSSAGTFCQGNDSRLSDDRTASGIRTATTVVAVSGATAPTIGQTLVATSGTAATWQTPLALTSNAPANVTKAAAVVGVGTAAARDDHKHDITTAAAVATTVGGSNAEGTATSLARSDHTHALVAYGSTAGTICQGNDSRLSDDRTASGIRTATTVVSVSGATAPTTGQALVATSGTAATWQTIAPAVTVAEATGAITTSSGTDAAMTSMTITPAAGTYLVWFSGDISHSANGGTISTSIYVAASQQTNSIRNYARGNQTESISFACMAKVTVNGAQAITGQWSTSGATATNTHRQLMIHPAT